MKDYPAEKYSRDAKLLTIGEGTSQILRILIGKQLQTSATRPELAVASRAGSGR